MSHQRHNRRSLSQNNIDLNNIPVENDGNFNPDMGLTKATSANKDVTVYFRDIEQNLLNHIEVSECVVGCVAWLTNSKLLSALSSVPNVSIIVQKEDFLRPDLNSGDHWRGKLRAMYARLNCNLTRYEFPGIVGKLSTATDPTIVPVRCVGNYNRDKNPAFPRMHHKFIVFCRTEVAQQQNIMYDEQEEEIGLEFFPESVKPYAVWTGSFNFTENAVRSLENGLYLTDPNIVQAYYDEWARTMAVSEQLDWESDWAAPEWRIGS